MSGNQVYDFDIVVAGGGASGMTAACFCASFGKKTALLEKNDVLGKKISVTGNGKCNLSNEKMDAGCYNGDKAFVTELLLEYPVESVLAWFEKLGIKTVSKNGYLYPMSEQAKSVSEALEREAINSKVSVFKGTLINSVEKKSNLFYITCSDKEGNTMTYRSKKLVLAVGGPASVHGGTDLGIKILKNLGHKVNNVRPALVALTSPDKILKKLAGVRLPATVTLSTVGEEHSDSGEIIFNDGNVSGIPVFQISRFLEPAKDKNAKLIIDLLPELSREEAAKFISDVAKHNPKLTYEQLFRGILNYKAVYYIFEKNKINAETVCGNLSSFKAFELVDCFKSFTLDISGTKGFESAQTSAGGAELSEFDGKTLESLKVKGLYVTGELLDVDGICGGYNLHFAWATGMKAGKAAAQTF